MAKSGNPEKAGNSPARTTASRNISSFLPPKVKPSAETTLPDRGISVYPRVSLIILLSTSPNHALPANGVPLKSGVGPPTLETARKHLGITATPAEDSRPTTKSVGRVPSRGAAKGKDHRHDIDSTQTDQVQGPAPKHDTASTPPFAREGKTSVFVFHDDGKKSDKRTCNDHPLAMGVGGGQ